MPATIRNDAGAAAGFFLRGPPPTAFALNACSNLSKRRRSPQILIVDLALRRRRFPGRKPFGRQIREHGQIVAKVVDVAWLRQDYDQRARSMPGQRSRNQRTARTSHAVKRGAVAGLQAGRDLAKAFAAFQSPD